MSTELYDGGHPHPGIQHSLDLLSAALMNAAGKDHDHPELVEALGAAILMVAEKNHPHPEIESILSGVETRLAILEQPPHEPDLHDGAVVIAAQDWPWKSGAHFVCDGIDDQVEIQQAHDALPASSGKMVLTAGTFNVTDTTRITKDYTWLDAFGPATILKPSPSFPADKYIVSVYRNDTSPLNKAVLSNFAIRGHGIPFANTINGIEFCAFRGGMDRIWVNRLPGTGLWVHNVPGALGNPDGWNCYESTFSHLNIGNNGIGLLANSTDQHWTDVQIYSNSECNVRGSFTGTMISNAHFFGGADNILNQQTLVNMELWGCSRMSVIGSKIEHAQRELVRLTKTRGGNIRWLGVGFRNGCSRIVVNDAGVRVPTDSQMYIESDKNNWHSMTMVGCRFDKDAAISLPKNSIEIVSDYFRNSRIDATDFSGYAVEPITPFADDPLHPIGLRSTLNGWGVNHGDPNLGGGWRGYGLFGLQVRDELSGKKWFAVSKNLWE
jgi:hypothetical protein